MSGKLTIFVEKYDDEFEIEYDPEMTLETFKNCMEEVFGPIKLNVSYKKNKDKKMKDIAAEYNSIAFLNNENLGHKIQKSKVNFINESNSCFKNSFTVTLRSLIPKICEKEEKNRLDKGLPVLKDFKSLRNPENPDDDLWYGLLELLDILKDKGKKNDTTPIKNTFDPKNSKFDNQKYKTGENYAPNTMCKLAQDSTHSSRGLRGGSIDLDIILKNTDFVNNHEIYLVKQTIISDCITIEVRCFQNCSVCNFSNISVINFGNIAIDMYDFVNSEEEKSFDALLNYYYKTNFFGKENLKKENTCSKCYSNSLQFYNKMSTLPEILYIDFNWGKFSSLSGIKSDWILKEEISLLKHYDNVNFGKIDYYYRLISFVAYYTWGHFVNFSKIDGCWYLFDDLSDGPAEKINGKGTFNDAKQRSDGLIICYCFYEKYKCKGYENYIQKIKEIIGKK